MVIRTLKGLGKRKKADMYLKCGRYVWRLFLSKMHPINNSNAIHRYFNIETIKMNVLYMKEIGVGREDDEDKVDI